MLNEWLESRSAAGRIGSSTLVHCFLCCDWASRAKILPNGPIIWDVSVVVVMEEGWVVYYLNQKSSKAALYKEVDVGRWILFQNFKLTDFCSFWWHGLCLRKPVGDRKIKFQNIWNIWKPPRHHLIWRTITNFEVTVNIVVHFKYAPILNGVLGVDGKFIFVVSYVRSLTRLSNDANMLIFFWLRLWWLPYWELTTSTVQHIVGILSRVLRSNLHWNGRSGMIVCVQYNTPVNV